VETPDFAEQRDDLLLSIEKDRQEVRTAVTELSNAAGLHLDLGGRTRALIRERPVVAVIAAAGLGYLVARLVSRVSR
jgi:ElaB/YqjD/DUF883 family membrane-anchored ribosome-binding protein